MNAIVISALLGVLMMLSGLFFKRSAAIQWTAIAGSAILLVGSILELIPAGQNKMFYGMLELHHVSSWFNVLMSACVMLYILLFHRSIAKVGRNDAEYFALIFFVMCGIYLMSMYSNLLILFLGIEIMSIPQYIMAGSDKENIKSNESALKYFLMGSFSTGILLMGITLIYGATGSFDLLSPKFTAVFQSGADPSSLAMIGVLLLIVAFGFKTSSSPFHFWTPDVYDGSPTAFTPFMASIVKVGVFMAFIRLFHLSFIQMASHWQLMMALMIALTLLIGNITAVYQQSVKRMLAYSSIAQAGFMLFAVFSTNQTAWDGMMLYSVAYTLSTLGIFAVLIKMKDYTYDGFKGLGKKEPVLAATATICLLSLAGIPLTGGFFAKYFVLNAAMDQGLWIALIIFAVLMAAVSAYYYFKVIMSMYFYEGDAELTEESNAVEKTLMIINAVLVILLGVMPGLILNH